MLPRDGKLNQRKGIIVKHLKSQKFSFSKTKTVFKKQWVARSRLIVSVLIRERSSREQK